VFCIRYKMHIQVSNQAQKLQLFQKSVSTHSVYSMFQKIPDKMIYYKSPRPTDMQCGHGEKDDVPLESYRILKPRLHDTTGCQTGCTTGFTTGCIV